MVKKPKDTTTTKRKTVYELVGGERRPPFTRGIDPLDDILFDEERELSREVKRIRLEQIVMKKRREIERMKQQGGEMDMGSLPSNTDFLNMAKFMAELSPEEAQRVRSAYTFFKLAEKGGGGGMSIMPMLLNYAKQNPGASENQMINYLKLMDSQLMKGLEIAKVMNPKTGKSEANEIVNYLKLMDSQFSKGLELAKAANPNPAKSDANAMEFLKLMKDLVIEGVRNPLMQAIKENQPSPGVFEQILTKPELWNRFKEIGLFGGKQGGAGTTEMDLKIAQITTANTLEMKKMDLEWRKSMLVRESEDRKTDALVSALTPLSMLFAGPLDQRMKQFGRQQAAGHNPGGMPPGGIQPGAMSQKNTFLIQCDCGYQGSKTFPGAVPSSFSCPQCGGDLIVGGAPGGGEPQETDTGT